MAEWATLPLPQHKGTPGWEFTELKNFDLASFPRATTVAPKTGAGVEVPEPVFPAPAGAVELTQVDGTWKAVEEATVE